MERILLVSVMLVALLLSACGAPSTTPTPTPIAPVSPGATADIQHILNKVNQRMGISNEEMMRLQAWYNEQRIPTLEKQIDGLNQRMEDLKRRVDGSWLAGGLESRVNDLEREVGGKYSLGGGSLSSLQSRVSDLEREVESRVGGLESRVNDLERQSGGSRW